MISRVRGRQSNEHIVRDSKSLRRRRTANASQLLHQQDRSSHHIQLPRSTCTAGDRVQLWRRTRRWKPPSASRRSSSRLSPRSPSVLSSACVRRGAQRGFRRPKPCVTSSPRRVGLARRQREHPRKVFTARVRRCRAVVGQPPSSEFLTPAAAPTLRLREDGRKRVSAVIATRRHRPAIRHL